MIDQAEWLFEPRMRDRSGEQVGFKPAESIHELHSGCTKLGKDVLDAACVVPGFVSFPIAQVGSCEFSDAREVIVDSRQLQGLEVSQMSGMLLGRPLFSRFLH
jgi:hypothetical protein